MSVCEAEQGRMCDVHKHSEIRTAQSLQLLEVSSVTSFAVLSTGESSSPVRRVWKKNLIERLLPVLEASISSHGLLLTVSSCSFFSLQ